MKRSAQVYRRRDQYFVAGSDKTKAGFWIESQHWALPTAIPPEDLAEAVGKGLERSQTGVPTPPRQDLSNLQKPLFKLAGVKSFTAFERGALSVEVFEEDGVITVTPTHNAGDGFTDLTDLAKTTRPGELASALLSAFDDCTSVFT